MRFSQMFEYAALSNGYVREMENCVRQKINGWCSTY